MLKWFGAVLIVAGGGYFGFCMAAAHRLEEDCLRRLIAALDFMQCELQFRMTPLPELCALAGREQGKLMGRFFTQLGEELSFGISPDVGGCVHRVLGGMGPIPTSAHRALTMLGSSLGRFDVDGQVLGLESVRAFCRNQLEQLAVDRDARLRGYQTLGLCAGAALAILLV